MKVGDMIAQTTTDPDLKVYNVRYELTESAVEDGKRGDPGSLGAFGKLVLTTRGVEMVRVQPYRFFISKASAFDWSEIDPTIFEILGALTSSQKLLMNPKLPSEQAA